MSISMDSMKVSWNALAKVESPLGCFSQKYERYVGTSPFDEQ